MLLLLGVLLAVLAGAGVLGSLARGLGAHQQQRGAADLAALAGAEAMRAAQPRLFEPAQLDRGVPNPRHLERAAYLALARRVALQTARRNGARDVAVAFPGGGALAPTRIAVTVRDPLHAAGRELASTARAVAEITPVTLPSAGGDLAGEYGGPLAQRQGKRMRRDVALAFDRMSAAARADGVALIITSAFRSNAEQAALFAAHPDPKWVAPPGQAPHPPRTRPDPRPQRGDGWP